MGLIKVALDASRVRSGGGIAHLIGILSIADPTEFGIAEIHVWSHSRLLALLPDHKWLVKHHHVALERSLVHQVWWQMMQLSRAVKLASCQILFSADASTFCRFKPMIVLNQNMLAYDEGVLPLFGWSRVRVQQTLMYVVQRSAFRFAEGSIFLTNHAAKQVQRRVGRLQKTACIAHGVADIFKQTSTRRMWPTSGERAIRCLYVSPVFEYKHQAEVVQAVKILRDQGVNLSLTLVGGGGQRALNLLDKLLAEVDPGSSFVQLLDFLPNDEVAGLIAEADLYIFASSCETFGIALLEAMAVGLPIACSNRSSLPETLRDGGEYFDPRDPLSIVRAIDRLVTDPGRRDQLAFRAKELAQQYSWARSAQETWTFVVQTYHGMPAKAAV